MPKNIEEIKNKIINFIKERGPVLPTALIKISEMNLTITSAILSELVKEKKLKTSNLMVGSSPLYLIEGQEEKLENFIDELKPKEKEAFLKLKENKILEDEKQDPALRVALRNIKDFAIPIKKNEKLYWKYHLLPDKKAFEAISEPNEENIAVGHERIIGQSLLEDIKKQGLLIEEKNEEALKKAVENIIRRINEEREEIKEKKIKTIKEKKVKKEKFLELIKTKLSEKGIRIAEVIKEDKSYLIVYGFKENRKILIFAFNKKTANETELVKLYKKFFDEKVYDFLLILLKTGKTNKITEKINFYKHLEGVIEI